MLSFKLTVVIRPVDGYAQMTVLYVEDDREDFDVFVDALHAAYGKEAFKVLKKAIPDYIFIDINIPVMTGKQFLLKIKSVAGLNGIPVIVLSTSHSEEDVHECKKLGALDFLTKPTDFRTFCNELKKYL